MKLLLISIISFLIQYSLLSQTTSETLRQEALISINSGKYGEAINLMNRYISANPQDASGFNLRGSCYEIQGQYEKALYDYRLALKLEPDNEDYKTNLTRSKDEFYKLVYNYIEGYKRGIAIDPSNPQNYLEIGKNYKSLGEWEEAKKWYDRYLHREEASSDEILRYTEILAKNNHILKGVLILKTYTQNYPQDHRLWSRYGYFTMWTGQKINSLEAFENALELRPYFKEAIDGYDLVREKGYVYTVSDTTVRFNYGLPTPTSYSQYPIDKYYRKLEKNPDDIVTLYLLLDELVKNDRFYEANQQLKLLSVSEADKQKFNDLKKEVLEKQDQFFTVKISSLESELSSRPTDPNLVLELGKYYSYKKNYSDAIDIYDEYLSINPDDNEIRYQKTLVYSQLGNLSAAREEIEILLNNDPTNDDYQLLYGQVLVWQNDDLDVAYKNLHTVLKQDPDNFSAIMAMAWLNFQFNDLANAEYYASLGYQLDPLNSDVLQIEEAIKLQAERNKDVELYNLLEQARGYVVNKDCDNAIYYYNMYFEDPSVDEYLRKELAEAYLCAHNLQEALKIYNELIWEYPDDYDLVKQRAKIYYWSGDSLAAVSEFKNLSSLHPDDDEVKLYLGDSYVKAGDYKNARRIYEELLDISPSSEILQTRLKWLGSAGYTTSFPAHFSIIPEANYYNDNLNFTYNTQGVRLGLGITNYLSLGINGYFGTVSSSLTRLNLNILRADGYYNFSNYVSAYVAAGVTNFEDGQSSAIIEAYIKAMKKNNYNFSLSFYSSDAVQILYSPFLVDDRLTAYYSLLTAEYIVSTLLLRADFAYTSVSDNNEGTKAIVRFGKIFNEVFAVGYENYWYNFKNQTPLYWSPDNFESRSIWAYWDVNFGNSFKMNLSGKVGIIPTENNYLLREFQGYFTYNLTERFLLQARLSIGSSVRENEGYSSISFGFSAYWRL